MRRLALAMLLLIFASPVAAEEIHILGGYGVDSNPNRKAGAYQIEYLEGLGEHFAFSLSYLNQGHFPEHHRDGNSFNLWLRTNQFHPQLSLAAGIGVMYYYDTTHPPPGTPSEDVHGLASMYSLSATWYTESRVIFQLQTYWVKANASFDTVSALVGIGYQFDAPPKPGPLAKAPPQTKRTTENELTLLGGQTIVNVPGDGHSQAISLEYRRGIWRFVEMTATALYEGRSTLCDRYGLTTQLWLARPFFDDHVALGIGFGPYFAVDRRRQNDNEIIIPTIFTASAGFRLTPHWLLRASWNRVITNYNRDSDIFMGGIGYRF
ncbi:hypothetical protein [Geobacter grbiciae]|uniref:hypothetical protein n=1 Tax=Geobacter grbiciae TaxID=155042 RepID=UPI001C01EE7F|nr:hypothetical protein [Geobacter grbiciae]MBT1076879.1 hypothetical protein [Geobacter grbiciae]